MPPGNALRAKRRPTIAYQVIGHGPFDLVYVPGFVSHVELRWRVPLFARGLEQLAAFSRLLLFDKRGTGMSDRVAGAPTLEARMDDLRAVMDDVGSARAAIFGVAEGAPMSLLFAATYPERTAALVLRGGFPRMMWAPDYPWGRSEEQYRADLEADLRLYGRRAEAAAQVGSLPGCGRKRTRARSSITSAGLRALARSRGLRG